MKTYPIQGGIAGKILRVNLSNRKIWTENTEKYARRFFGGRTLANFILLNEMSMETKWSDPENMIIFSSGIFEGTFIPGACRVSIDTKNPFNDGKGSANCGGHFGPELKFAGFDSVVITGKAEKPVYLWIHDGTAELRDANLVWGKSTFATERILRKELHDEGVEVMLIGPAGENRVKAANVLCDLGKNAGGSGVGCVMGDKRLKAIAVRGNGVIKVPNPDKFMEVASAAREKIAQASGTKVWRENTIIEAGYMPDMEENWDLWTTVRNGQDDYWPMDKRKRFYEAAVKYRKGKYACFGCPIGCMPFQKIEKGKYAGTVANGFWINDAWWLQRFDVDDPETIMKYRSLINELGLDGDNTAVPLSWAFECYEKGLITKKDTDGLELVWGNGDAVIEMVRKLAYREGIGDFLADGVKKASEKLGKGSEKFATHMKGQDTVDPYRAAKGWALGLSTSPVAGRHLRGAVGGLGWFGPYRFTSEKATVVPTEYEGQPEMVFWQLKTKEIEDMTGLCSYMGSYSGGALSPSDYVNLINAVTDLKLTEDEMMLFARSSYNLEKAFNTIHAGFDREEDLPPVRYMEEPIKSGPLKGEKLDKTKYNKMLDRFYQLQEWDIKTGLQTRKCLIKLDLEDIMEKLKEVGKLIEDSDYK